MSSMNLDNSKNTDNTNINNFHLFGLIHMDYPESFKDLFNTQEEIDAEIDEIKKLFMKKLLMIGLLQSQNDHLFEELKKLCELKNNETDDIKNDNYKNIENVDINIHDDANDTDSDNNTEINDENNNCQNVENIKNIENVDINANTNSDNKIKTIITRMRLMTNKLFNFM